MSTKLWDEQRGVIRTTKGGWQINKGVTIHGHSLLDTLLPECSWFQVWILSITGRLPERRLADWTESVWMCMSYPDPRIWCNQVSSLAGTMKCSPVAAASAASMTSDALRYASWAALHAAQWFEENLPRRLNGESVETILSSRPKNAKGCPQVPGFSRPVAVGDERIPVIEKQRIRYGYERGANLTFAYEIHHYLKEHFNEEINGGGYAPAFMLDQGFSSEEIYRFYSMGIQAGAMACYVDAYDKPAETFLPMQCSDINYEGPAHRKFPK
jgi:hypothetical protein